VPILRRLQRLVSPDLRYNRENEAHFRRAVQTSLDEVRSVVSGISFTDSGPGFTYPRRTTEITSTEVWYYASILAAAGNPSSFATAGGTGTIKAFPFWSGAFDLTVIRIAFRVQAAGGAGAKGRVGIYTSAADGTLYPDALVVDGGEFATDATGVKSATISETLTKDTLYWFAYLGGTSSANVNGFNTDDCWSPLGHQSFGTKHMGWSHSQTYGALPSTFPSGTPAVLGNFSIAIGVRATT
jgi:hypothetical protein